MFCTSCGSELKEGAHFCTKCGVSARGGNQGGASASADKGTDATTASTPTGSSAAFMVANSLADANAMEAPSAGNPAETPGAGTFKRAVETGRKRGRGKMSPIMIVVLVIALMSGTALAAHYVYQNVYLPALQAQAQAAHEEGPQPAESSSVEQESQEVNEAWAQFPQTLVFTSGAGAWNTRLDIAADGTFIGYYHDADMGDTGTGYPKGTRYETHFEGEFTEPKKVSDYEYVMQLKSLTITDSPGEAIEDGVRIIYITDGVYGLGGETAQPTGEFKLYLPGQPLSGFSDSAAYWLFVENTSSKPSDFYAIVNSSNADVDLAFRTYDTEYE